LLFARFNCGAQLFYLGSEAATIAPVGFIASIGLSRALLR